MRTSFWRRSNIHVPGNYKFCIMILFYYFIQKHRQSLWMLIIRPYNTIQMFLSVSLKTFIKTQHTCIMVIEKKNNISVHEIINLNNACSRVTAYTFDISTQNIWCPLTIIHVLLIRNICKIVRWCTCFGGSKSIEICIRTFTCSEVILNCT